MVGLRGAVGITYQPLHSAPTINYKSCIIPCLFLRSSAFSLVVTIVLRLSSRASTPHFSFIFYDHFCSEHRAPRHLAPNIHVGTLFMLRTLSATTLGSEYSCSSIIYVTYIERHDTWLRSFMFSYHSCYVHRAPCHLAPNIHVRTSFTLRTSIASCYFALTSS